MVKYNIFAVSPATLLWLSLQRVPSLSSTAPPVPLLSRRATVTSSMAGVTPPHPSGSAPPFIYLLMLAPIFLHRFHCRVRPLPHPVATPPLSSVVCQRSCAPNLISVIEMCLLQILLRYVTTLVVLWFLLRYVVEMSLLLFSPEDAVMILLLQVSTNCCGHSVQR